MQADSIDPNVALFIKKTYDILEVRIWPSRILNTVKSYTGYLLVENSPSRIRIRSSQIFYPFSSGIAIFTPS
jgi:hypothetical protein